MYLLSIGIWNASHLTKCDKLQDKTNKIIHKKFPQNKPKVHTLLKNILNKSKSIQYNSKNIQYKCFVIQNIGKGIDMQNTPSAMLLCLQSAFQNNIALIYWVEEHLTFCGPPRAEDNTRDSRLPLLFNYIYFLCKILPNDETRYWTKILGDNSIYLSIRLEIKELDWWRLKSLVW